MKAVNIADLRELARRRVPGIVFDYLDGGAEAEVTMQENRRAFQEVLFRPQQAVASRECNLQTRVLGCDLSMPVLLAPVGYLRVMHPGGEIASARAACRGGAGFVLSTVSGHKLEDVRTACSGPAWFQLYLTGGRAAAEQALERAQSAGYEVLVVTIDTTVIGQRERELRSGMEQLLRGSFWSKLPFTPQLFAHPRWLVRFLLDGGLPRMANIVHPEKGPLRVSQAHTALVRSAFSWPDMAWIRQVWKRPIVIKGVLTRNDARRSLDEGASGLVVSNHGGRQLDGVQASLRALPEILGAVEGRAEVLLDGGIRRGADIVKALCMGARAVLIGRAFAYGLAAAGEAGVTRAVQILREDMERTLRLLGCHSVEQLNRTYLDIPKVM
ncbi:MAG TPA: alpha-hydroxy acid oxidase [Terriglobales bacterium]|jgi:L-lactate dehydrogenase (cytochrome)|nr:alpha-hydroxy acid oxidase [Terriglobales bacterium]